MPTPDDDNRQIPHVVVQRERSAHATCPQDSGRFERRRTHSTSRSTQRASRNTQSTSRQTQSASRQTQNGLPNTHSQEQPESLLGDAENLGQAETHIDQDFHTKMEDVEQEQLSSDGQSPISSTIEARDAELHSSLPPQPSIQPSVSTHSTNHEFSNIRVPLPNRPERVEADLS